MKISKLCILLAMFFYVASASAQEWLKMHRFDIGTSWTTPLEFSKYSQYDFGKKTLNAYAILEDGSELKVPFDIEVIDSIDFAYELTDDEKGHDKYRTFAMYITTENLADIREKEVWIPCNIAIDGMGEYSDYSGTGRIRGRGNSTWEWYDKKPYKFKLDSKSKLLGMEKAKDWNLLANYRDVTDLMNALAFEVARCLGMPYTNHTRYVEVFLNDEYIGLYQLTEKIEIDKNRVDIDKTEGWLLSIDLDDGPSLSPSDGDNFWTSVYRLPMCVKSPEGLTKELLDSIKNDFAILEQAIKNHDYNEVSELLDLESFMGILQIHEYLYNVEIDAPRSLYLFKDKDGKYTFGPVWDYDAGFDFDWANMTTGHTFFSNYRELMYGTVPATHTGANYNINSFFTDMFRDDTFASQYKEKWASASDTLLTVAWDKMEQYIKHFNDDGVYEREFLRWPISGKKVADEIEKMHTWLKNRLNYINTVVAGYPSGSIVKPSEDQTYVVSGNTIKITKDAAKASGYHQTTQIVINESDVTSYLGGAPTALQPLNSDGSIGRNTAAGTYGAWFDSWGDTNSWNMGHTFIESNDLYNWNFGCHPQNCSAGDTHTVKMQYSRNNRKMIVEVTFTVK